MTDDILSQITTAAEASYRRYVERETQKIREKTHGQDQEICNGLFTSQQHCINGQQTFI